MQERKPDFGKRVEERRGGGVDAPDTPLIAYIEGDGTGPEIMGATRRTLDAAVLAAYGSARRIAWFELLAGEKAHARTGSYLPDETVDAIAEHLVAIKGPLTTPVGGGFRSLNVTLRIKLDLYANVRPSRYFKGVPSPLAHPERINMVVFRENTEDVYAGIEWEAGSREAGALRRFLDESFGVAVREDSGIGIKPISRTCTRRLVKKAIDHAIEHSLPSVTLVHKGNIMKYTEGAFRAWGYELAKEYGDAVVTESDLTGERGGRVLIKDRIADNMFQQVLTRSDEYSVLATPNLNGDYLSDEISATVGGLGLAPGANIGEHAALFEPVHGTAPKYAGKNVINPTAGFLSGALMLSYIGWKEAHDAVYAAVAACVADGKVTYDLARHTGVEPLGTREYADAVIAELAR